MPDSLEALELYGRFGSPYLYEPECESTQLLLLGSDLPEGAVAVTDHQTAGRGRLGRRWEEPPGTSALCSVLLRPPPERHAPELSLLAALAAAEAIELATDLSTQVKWPNDVMLNRRKVAGVLAEMQAPLVVVGIGINVNQTPEQLPDGASTPAGSLRSVTGCEHDRGALLASLLSVLERLYEGWLSGGFAEARAELAARDFLRGRRVTVEGETGIAVGIDPSGRLEVELDGELRLVASGEIEYER